MPKYRILLETEAFASVEVEADSAEEALEKMWEEEELPWSCHQCPEVGEWSFPPERDSSLKLDHYITEIKGDA